MVKSMVAGDLPHRLRAFHETYGPVIRTAPNELSFTDAAAWRDIYPPNFVRPREFKDKPPGKDAENLISASELDHARFRKVLAPAFSEKAVREQEPMIQRHVGILLSKFREAIDHGKKEEGAVMDLLQWLNYTFFDIIGDFVWGSSFNCLTLEKEHPWIQVIAQFKNALMVGALKFYPPVDRVLNAVTPKSAMADLWMIWRTTETKIAERLMKPADACKDVLSHVMNATESEDHFRMTRDELEINAMLLVIAGSESSTTVLLGIFNQLLRDPSKLDTLTQEVRTHCVKEQDITGKSLNKLPYLGAVFHEGLRLCPTFPDGLRREVPSGGAAVAGHFLPEATIVSIPQWAAYLSPDNFYEPLLFKPERWLVDPADDSTPYSQDRRDVFNPFLLGSHNCPGRSLAYLETQLVLAKLIWSFDMAAEVLPVWENQRIYWFWEKQQMMVRLRHRQPQNL